MKQEQAAPGATRLLGVISQKTELFIAQLWESQIQLLLHSVQIGSVAHSASYTKGFWRLFPQR
jgi:hypothetical protein